MIILNFHLPNAKSHYRKKRSKYKCELALFSNNMIDRRESILRVFLWYTMSAVFLVLPLSNFVQPGNITQFVIEIIIFVQDYECGNNLHLDIKLIFIFSFQFLPLE